MYLFCVSVHACVFIFMYNCVCALLMYASVFAPVCMFMCAACLHTYDHLLHVCEAMCLLVDVCVFVFRYCICMSVYA